VEGVLTGNLRNCYTYNERRIEIMATADGKTVFALGSELAGNREVVIVENDEEYSLDAAAIVEYSDDTAQFPYTV
jgi:hypothetical protein